MIAPCGGYRGSDDVVYNHTYRTEILNNTALLLFRQNADGSFSIYSGCGNEFASERPMARRYLTDSIPTGRRSTTSTASGST